MNKEFCIGLVIGMLAGAVVVNNVPKVKRLVDKGQKIVVEKIKSLGKSKISDDQDAAGSDEYGYGGDEDQKVKQV
ncbi:MAG: hypothetical protein J5762_07855 [Clostridia bacterium]|nr:hypothetical protein [Clostridia bacterium]